MNGKFESYDYGESGNEEHYGQPGPVQYQLDRVTAPTAIFKSDADDLADLVDIDLLVNQLPNVVSYNNSNQKAVESLLTMQVMDHMVERDGWTHTDYIVAMDADRLVYDYVLDLVRDH